MSSLRTDLPAAFLERMARLLGDEFAAFLASYTVPPAVGLRANTLKTTPAELVKRVPFALTPVPGVPEGFVVTDDSRPGKHPYFAAGLYYLQDPAAMLAGTLVEARPGERVLDLAAAPGGKATHLAAQLQGQGLLLANEVVRSRAWDLAENLERWGASNAIISNEAPERLARRLPGYFDCVLLDAPCSGEGMFRRLPPAREEWLPGLIAGCALRQRAILADAAALVRPGGRLIYVTCTFAPEENEAVVARFLREQPQFALVQPPTLPGSAPGRPEWVDEGLRRPELARTVRLWPHTGSGEGHFVAVLRREDGPAGRGPARVALPALPGALLAQYRRFCVETFGRTVHDGRLLLTGSHLYDVPEATPALSGIRLIHPGRWLGVFKKGRFEPAHALALSIPAGLAQQRVDLPAADPRLLDYLRGLTFTATGRDGWLLVTVEGFPVGWGKRVGNVVKNHYPRGLRREYV